jgi:Asp-tRNA(Asn)/Glu-tRNA(Gln) amidotransferase A subunit family amidase
MHALFARTRNVSITDLPVGIYIVHNFFAEHNLFFAASARKRTSRWSETTPAGARKNGARKN